MDVRAVYAVRGVIAVEIGHFAVRHFLGLRDHAYHVHTESVNAFVTPPGHHIEDFVADFWVIPVQVRLLFGEQMQVIHCGLFVILPCGTAETGAPVIGRRLSILSLSPDIVIPVVVFF